MKKRRIKSLKSSLIIEDSLKQKVLKGEEVWVDIVGLEGLFQVSSKGNVRSLDRTVTYLRKYKSKKKPITVTVNLKGRMYTIKSNRVYQGFTMNHPQLGRIFTYVHRAMVEAFFGVKTDYRVMCDHIDSDKHNNDITNLQVVTSRYNVNKDVNKKKTSSKFTGVHYNKKTAKFVASIYIDGKKVYLGTSDDEAECGMMYQQAVIGLTNI